MIIRPLKGEDMYPQGPLPDESAYQYRGGGNVAARLVDSMSDSPGMGLLYTLTVTPAVKFIKNSPVWYFPFGLHFEVDRVAAGAMFGVLWVPEGSRIYDECRARDYKRLAYSVAVALNEIAGLVDDVNEIRAAIKEEQQDVTAPPPLRASLGLRVRWGFRISAQP